MDHAKADTKPLLRGHFHQAAFFLALGACIMLIAKSQNLREAMAMIIYSLSLTGLFGVSALYHRPQWSAHRRMWMRRFDHAAIFVLIAGTGTPLCLLALSSDAGTRLLILIWAAAAVGIVQSLFWVHAPKWVSAIIYIGAGWLAVPYLPEFKAALGLRQATLLLGGGLVFTLGAVVYASKKPNPSPRVFGYHEIFHLIVVVAAIMHFIVIAGLIA